MPDKPWRGQAADQEWAAACESLDRLLTMLHGNEPQIYSYAQQSGPSVLFDFMKSYVAQSEREAAEFSRQARGADEINAADVSFGHRATALFCAAAVTKLACAPHAPDDPLAQLEKEIGQQ